VLWYQCRHKISKCCESNPFKSPLTDAFIAREEQLLQNLSLTAAVYVDPRLHHNKTSPELLGSLAEDSEAS
jgi:hypothetical protein